MRFKSLAIFIISLISLQSSGQIIHVSSEFEADSIMIGRQVNYSITVETEQDVFVRLPEYSDTISAQLEILASSETDTSFANDVQILSREYVLTSFEPGWNTLRPQPVIYEIGEITDTIYTSALLITVLAPVVDTAQVIKPIKPPVNTPVSFAEIFPWALLALGVILLAILGIYLYRRYAKKKEDPEFFQRKPLEPAHVIAFRELEALKHDKLPQNGRVKEYYSKLTEIVRLYMSRQYKINAMESTSAEILEAFVNYNSDEKKHKELLEELLMLADLVKFAKEDPLMEENERHHANAAYFVEHTYRMFLEEEKEIETGEEEEIVESEVESIKEEESNG